MAYAEKRGKGPQPWRVKYKLPDGTWDSCSGFETKEEALNYGRDQESDIRRGQWFDHRAGEITLSKWVEEHWWPAQDLSLKSRTNYWGSISNHVLPAFGRRPLNSIDSPTEIAAWEKRVSARNGPEAAKAARSRLISILGDAVAEKRMQTNPALRPRKRGRRTKVAGRQAEKVWATPLQVLLFAERCALMSGWDGDMVMMLAIAYTGMRWGETIGLEPSYVRLDAIRIEWQLVEDGGKFYRLPPKDDSFRTADTPPFLSDLLSRQKQTMAAMQCRHVQWEPRTDTDDGEEPCPGGRKYLWIGERGGHPRNSNYIRRIFDPACEGWYPKDHNRPGPARPVLVDGSSPWPCRPLPGIKPYGPEDRPEGFLGHRGAVLDLEQTPPACWTPLVPGLTPHGLRHSHNVWMQEDNVPEVLRHDRLGHDLEGMTAVYSHVSPAMRAELRDALQRRWKESLEARAEFAPRSPVPLLDELLAPYRRRRRRRGSQRGKVISQMAPKMQKTASR